MTHIAFYGGSFNPPTIAHEAIVNHLIKQTTFDKVIVKPCGTRQDKPELLQTLDSRRIRVTEKLSRNNPHYHLDLRAMEKPMVPTIQEWQNLRSQNPNSTIYFVTGSDLFIVESDGLCQIEKWIEGITLFSEAYFYIFPRPFEGKIKYPPNHCLVDNFTPINISSSELRKRETLEGSN